MQLSLQLYWIAALVMCKTAAKMLPLTDWTYVKIVAAFNVNFFACKEGVFMAL